MKRPNHFATVSWQGATRGYEPMLACGSKSLGAAETTEWALVQCGACLRVRASWARWGDKRAAMPVDVSDPEPMDRGWSPVRRSDGKLSRYQVQSWTAPAGIAWTLIVYGPDGREVNAVCGQGDAARCNALALCLWLDEQDSEPSNAVIHAKRRELAR